MLMMNKVRRLGCLLLLFAFTTLGCSTKSMHEELRESPAWYGTWQKQSAIPALSKEELKRKNYEVLKVGLRGSSYGFMLFALIPVVKASHSTALHEIYDQVRAAGIKLEEKGLAFTNILEEKAGINLLLIGVPSLILTVDLIKLNE
jgi:hypothetical protein